MEEKFGEEFLKYKKEAPILQSHNTETLKKFSDEIVEVSELLDANAPRFERTW
jgi:hypothetical protein